MQQERQLRRRHKSLATGNHVTRGRMKIRSPALPFSKWEPPPYQPRDSPTDDGDVVRRPNRVVSGGNHPVQTANHFDPGPAAPPGTEAGRPAARHPRVSIVDATGVVVHRALSTKDSGGGGGRRRPRSVDAATAAACRTTRKDLPAPNAPRRRDRPPRRPPAEPEPTVDNAPQPPPPIVAHDAVAAVPIICNYVDPAPVRVDDHAATPPAEVRNPGHLLAPPGVYTAQLLAPPPPSARTQATSPGGVEIGVAVENEVREVKRMLRSFMAKLSQRDLRERNAFEWRIVALALDRLFFVIYLIIILVALASMFPWREVFALPKLAKTAGAK